MVLWCLYSDLIFSFFIVSVVITKFLVNICIRAVLQTLEPLGLTPEMLAQLKAWSSTRSVTLRFRAAERCEFLRKETRDIKSDTKNVSVSTLFGLFESVPECYGKLDEYIYRD